MYIIMLLYISPCHQAKAHGKPEKHMVSLEINMKSNTWPEPESP